MAKQARSAKDSDDGFARFRPSRRLFEPRRTRARGAGPAGAAKGSGQVFLVQAIEGQTLKIQVDGATVAQAAAPKSVIGPLSLAAGSHVVTYASGTKTLVSARFQMVAGNSQDVVAHIMADANMSPS